MQIFSFFLGHYFSLETTLHPFFLHHHFLGFSTTAAFNLQPIQVTSNSPSHGRPAPYLADLNHPSNNGSSIRLPFFKDYVSPGTFVSYLEGCGHDSPQLVGQ